MALKTPTKELKLVEDLGYLTCTYCTATFTDCEAKTFVKGYRSDKGNVNLYVISRHYHLYAFWESNLTGNVEGTDEELRTILVVEWSVTTTLFLLEDIDLSEEVLVRSD